MEVTPGKPLGNIRAFVDGYLSIQDRNDALALLKACRRASHSSEFPRGDTRAGRGAR
jgi:hypothetical protein